MGFTGKGDDVAEGSSDMGMCLVGLCVDVSEYLHTNYLNEINLLDSQLTVVVNQ